MSKMKELAGRVFEYVMKAGATGAQCSFNDSDEVEVSVRNRNVETKKAIREKNLSLSVWFGDKVGSVSGAADSWRMLAEKACEIAKVAPPDPFALLAPKDLWPREDAEEIFGKLDIYDDSVRPKMRDLIDWATHVEEAGLAVSKYCFPESARASYSKIRSAICTSDGLSVERRVTVFGVGVSFIGSRGEDLSSSGEYDQASHFSDLKPFSEIGRMGGENTIRLLGARPIGTGNMPVVFDRDVSKRFMQCFLSAIHGYNVYNARTFLKDKLGQQIFPGNINIVDDPYIPRLLRSDVVDSDGVGKRKINLVSRGVLKSWMLDLRSAAQLGMKSTGHAGGAGNFYMKNGRVTPERLISGIKHGLLVLGTSGSPNIVTGDYSVGAEGILIENGILTRPVDRITIAGNLLEMWKDMRIANDMEVGRYNIPTILVQNMTVAGE